MQGNQGHAKVVPPVVRTATRFVCNRNWCWRGDNTKYKEKK